MFSDSVRLCRLAARPPHPRKNPALPPCFYRRHRAQFPASLTGRFLDVTLSLHRFDDYTIDEHYGDDRNGDPAKSEMLRQSRTGADPNKLIRCENAVAPAIRLCKPKLLAAVSGASAFPTTSRSCAVRGRRKLPSRGLCQPARSPAMAWQASRGRLPARLRD
jgi:hypothetical protein